MTRIEDVIVVKRLIIRVHKERSDHDRIHGDFKILCPVVKKAAMQVIVSFDLEVEVEAGLLLLFAYADLLATHWWCRYQTSRAYN